MNGKFTPSAERALQETLRQAAGLGHTYIGSEHLLLGLAAAEDSPAAVALAEKGATHSRIREAVVGFAGEGAESHVTPSDMTPRVRHIIEASAREAERSGQSTVGTWIINGLSDGRPFAAYIFCAAVASSPFPPRP